jgi:hypothetical protein
MVIELITGRSLPLAPQAVVTSGGHQAQGEPCQVEHEEHAQRQDNQEGEQNVRDADTPPGWRLRILSIVAFRLPLAPALGLKVGWPHRSHHTPRSLRGLLGRVFTRVNLAHTKSVDGMGPATAKER